MDSRKGLDQCVLVCDLAAGILSLLLGSGIASVVVVKAEQEPDSRGKLVIGHIVLEGDLKGGEKDVSMVQIANGTQAAVGCSQ